MRRAFFLNASRHSSQAHRQSAHPVCLRLSQSKTQVPDVPGCVPACCCGECRAWTLQAILWLVCAWSCGSAKGLAAAWCMSWALLWQLKAASLDTCDLFWLVEWLVACCVGSRGCSRARARAGRAHQPCHHLWVPHRNRNQLAFGGCAWLPCCAVYAVLRSASLAGSPPSRAHKWVLQPALVAVTALQFLLCSCRWLRAVVLTQNSRLVGTDTYTRPCPAIPGGKSRILGCG
jgi:hypothetical protein